MSVKKKIGATLVTLGLATAGLVAATPAAQADTTCVIHGISPSTVTLGLTPKAVKFKPITSGCELEGWSIDARDFYVYDDSPTEVFNPDWQVWNSDAGSQHVVVTAYNADYDETVKVIQNGFTLKRNTTIGAFNASPEPVRKGKPITIKGKLSIVDWDDDRYEGFGGRTVSIQFRTPSGTYQTIKTARTSSTGSVNTTVTASRSGYWRLQYSGGSSTGASTVAGDYVQVK